MAGDSERFQAMVTSSEFGLSLIVLMSVRPFVVHSLEADVVGRLRIVSHESVSAAEIEVCDHKCLTFVPLPVGAALDATDPGDILKSDRRGSRVSGQLIRANARSEHRS